MARNFNEKFRNKVLKDLVYKVRSQYQPHKFQLCMEELKKLNEKYIHFFDKIDKEK